MGTATHKRAKPSNFKYDFASLAVGQSFEVAEDAAKSVRNASVQYVTKLKSQKVKKVDLPTFSTYKCEDNVYRCFRIK